jgi:hypothetical protein
MLPLVELKNSYHRFSESQGKIRLFFTAQILGLRGSAALPKL